MAISGTSSAFERGVEPAPRHQWDQAAHGGADSPHHGPGVPRPRRAAVSGDDVRYLETLAREGAAHPNGFRVTDVKEWLDVSQAGASGIVDRLLAGRKLTKVGRAGKSIYYQLTGAASIATQPVT